MRPPDPMRTWKRLTIALREFGMIAKAYLSEDHPLLAHLVPMRRCNLACAYCNEYDHSSEPVPLATVLARLDHLASLGTAIVTISGGEPLLHPDLDRIIGHIRRRGMIAGLITNGYLLSRERIKLLDRAGLEHMQISIDNIKPDDVSKKSLKVLDRKLRDLSELAYFKVNVNTVLGSGVPHPEDALVIGRRAVELGFTCTVSLVHDSQGAMRPLGPRERAVYLQLKQLARGLYPRWYRTFQENLVRGEPNDWRCRAGARYMYVCENGLVHYCSQQRGYPATPLERYGKADIRREYLTEKPCAPNCTLSCVHQASAADSWRSPQRLQALAFAADRRATLRRTSVDRASAGGSSSVASQPPRK